MMLPAIALGVLSGFQAAPGETRPSEHAPVYAFGLTVDMVPATDYAPRLVAPEEPAGVWLWQFYANERDGFDSVASWTRVDCGAGTFHFLHHVSFSDGQFFSQAREEAHTPAMPEEGSVAAGLLTHICDPDPGREVRRYTNHRTARETADEFFGSQ